MGHLHSRHSTIDRKVVYPKGNAQKAVIIASPLLKLSGELIETLVTGIDRCLEKRFAKLETLGKVWVDPALIDCPLPTQQRNEIFDAKTV